MLKIWGRKNSINVQKAMWAIGELGLAHERLDVGGPFGGLDAREFLAMNPHRRIPVLQDGDVVVWESNAIIRYLVSRYGQGGLWPASPADRALADAWMDWMQTTLYPDFIKVFWGLVRTPPSKRDMDAIGKANQRVGDSFRVLDESLGARAHVVGNSLTMGDIPLGATLYRYFTLDIERPSLPAVARMYAAMLERPAYREHVAFSYEDLRAKDD